MGSSPTVKQIRIAVYRYPRQDLTVDLGFAAGLFYEPGSVVQQPMLGIRIESDAGVTGEYMSQAPGALEQMRMFAPFLIGKDALQRELFYNQAKYILRKHDRIGIGPIDIALWDLAGKLHQAPTRAPARHDPGLPTIGSCNLRSARSEWGDPARLGRSPRWLIWSAT